MVQPQIGGLPYAGSGQIRGDPAHPRYSYRRVTTLLRREGFEVDPKRVACIRRKEGSR
jgi:hypothetical protein